MKIIMIRYQEVGRTSGNYQEIPFLSFIQHNIELSEVTAIIIRNDEAATMMMVAATIIMVAVTSESLISCVTKFQNESFFLQSAVFINDENKVCEK